MIASKIGLLKPSQAFAQKVEPAYAEHLANLVDPRLARIAANAINDHMEWIFRYYEREDRTRLVSSANIGVFRKLLVARCPAFQMMSDLEEGKHHRLISRAAEPVRPIRGLAETASIDGKELFIVGYHQPFTHALTTTVKFWRNWPD